MNCKQKSTQFLVWVQKRIYHNRFVYSIIIQSTVPRWMKQHIFILHVQKKIHKKTIQKNSNLINEYSLKITQLALIIKQEIGLQWCVIKNYYETMPAALQISLYNFNDNTHEFIFISITDSNFIINWTQLHNFVDKNHVQTIFANKTNSPSQNKTIKVTAMFIHEGD